MQVYVPHLSGTDLGKNPDVIAQYVWKKDYDEVASSDLVIAYVGQPSLGTGAELEIAREHKKEIILWWFVGEKVSRMARGNPAVKHKIEAGDEKDLAGRIKNILKG